MNTDQYKAWEAADRAKDPHAWAIHDHMMGQISSRQHKRKSNTLLFKVVVALVLVIAAIIITT